MKHTPLQKGFSFQINGGSYGGFYIRLTSLSWRICLGWLGITMFFMDIEPVFLAALKAYNHPSNSKEKE